MIINLSWYDCDISSRGSHKKGPGKGEGGVGGVTKGGTGLVKVKKKIGQCLVYIYGIYINV